MEMIKYFHFFQELFVIIVFKIEPKFFIFAIIIEGIIIIIIIAIIIIISIIFKFIVTIISKFLIKTTNFTIIVILFPIPLQTTSRKNLLF
jgi:hypothetical protein